MDSLIGEKMGQGKLTYTFSANTNVLSISAACPPPQPAGTTLTSYWGRKRHNRRKAEMESKLVLAENVYVNLPTPKKMEINYLKSL
jgi:hypothetical protein